MSGSLRSDPRAIRAARRARFPTVRASRPRPGRHHPASAADVRRALMAFGEEIYYGVESVELVPAPAGTARIVLAMLVGPGRIVLYDKARSPWRRGVGFAPRKGATLPAAGAARRGAGVARCAGAGRERCS